MPDVASAYSNGFSPVATLGRLSKTSPLSAAQRIPRSIRSWKPGCSQVRASWP